LSNRCDTEKDSKPTEILLEEKVHGCCILFQKNKSVSYGRYREQGVAMIVAQCVARAVVWKAFKAFELSFRRMRKKLGSFRQGFFRNESKLRSFQEWFRNVQ
jgi:hypothetical protein